jgi:hypothetical protein
MSPCMGDTWERGAKHTLFLPPPPLAALPLPMHTHIGTPLAPTQSTGEQAQDPLPAATPLLVLPLFVHEWGSPLGPKRVQKPWCMAQPLCTLVSAPAHERSTQMEEGRGGGGYCHVGDGAAPLLPPPCPADGLQRQHHPHFHPIPTLCARDRVPRGGGTACTLLPCGTLPLFACGGVQMGSTWESPTPPLPCPHVCA